MKVYRLTPGSDGVVAWPRLDAKTGSIVTIGTFDGLHKGHQALLRRVTDLAHSYSNRSVAILFDPRPAFVFSYRKAHDKTDPAPGVKDPDEILPVGERLRLLEQLGLDIAIVVRFTTPFAQTSYSSFLGQLISQRVGNSYNPVHTLGLHTLVLGRDARLGRDGKGDAATIERIAEAFRFFQVDIVDDRGPGFVHIPAGTVKGVPVERKVRVWSSSNLRHLLRTGDVTGAREITGRDHAISGTVVHGEGQGSKLGFPTANLDGIAGLVPGDGVYEGWLVDEGIEDKTASAGHQDDDGMDSGVHESTSVPSSRTVKAEGAPRRLPAAISIGTKPTFGQDIARVVEANVVDTGAAGGSAVDGSAAADSKSDNAGRTLDLYGHRVRLEFVEKIGGQRKFESVDDLVAAMGQWCAQARADLATK